MGSSPKPGNNGTSLAAIARPEHLGYAGRLVLVSRKWSGKTFKDHRGDREAWLIATLGLEPPDSAVHLAKHRRGLWSHARDSSRMHSSHTTEIYGSLS